jgi:hypothetical protein
LLVIGSDISTKNFGIVALEMIKNILCSFIELCYCKKDIEPAGRKDPKFFLFPHFNLIFMFCSNKLNPIRFSHHIFFCFHIPYSFLCCFTIFFFKAAFVSLMSPIGTQDMRGSDHSVIFVKFEATPNKA